MKISGKRSSLTSLISLVLFFLAHELKAMAAQLPYGGMSRALLMKPPDQGPHPFLTQFMENSSSDTFDKKSPKVAVNKLRRKTQSVENISKYGQPKRRSGNKNVSNFLPPLEPSSEEIDALLAIQELAEMNKMLEEDLEKAQVLAYDVLEDLRSILGDIKDGENEFAEPVDPKLRTTIEKAIAIWAYNQIKSTIEQTVEEPDSDRLLRLS